MLGTASWSPRCFMLYTASNKKDILGKVGKPLLGEKSSLSQCFLVCLIIYLFFFFLLFLCLPKPRWIKCFPHFSSWWESWDLRKLFLRIRLMFFFPVFASTTFSVYNPIVVLDFVPITYFVEARILCTPAHKHLLIYHYAGFSTTVSSLHMFLCL